MYGKAENTACIPRALWEQSTSRMLLWSGVGKLGDFRDCPGDKTSDRDWRSVGSASQISGTAVCYPILYYFLMPLYLLPLLSI